MLKNYFKIAIRNLVKQKYFTFINIIIFHFRPSLASCWGLIMKTAQGQPWAVSVPPLRFELRLLAPEANALSTELRGRAARFYHR